VLEWLTIGRVDCAVVYNVAPSAAIDLVPVLDEQLYLVSARPNELKGRERKLVGPAVTLAEVAEHELVIPSLPHSIRMLLETALANEGRKARVAMEVESVPAILDLVQQGEAHAVLALNAIQASGNADAFFARPIRKPKMTTTLWIATSSQRHRGPLIDQSTELVRELLLKLWA